MELSTAKELLIDIITNKKRHADYSRTVELSEKYKILLTGDGIEKLLIQFVQREEMLMFEQRVRLTKSITPAVGKMLQKPFFKVVRNKKIFKEIGIQEEKKKDAVKTMIDGFFGNSRKKNKGLDGFLQTRLVDYTFTDPNAWVVAEWERVEATKIPRPKPFVVSSEEAINFEVENNEAKWLCVMTNTKYKKPKNDKSEFDGKKYTLYDVNYTLVFEQVDKDEVMKENEELVKIGKDFFRFTYFEPKTGFLCAFRIGYERDLFTNGRTFVSPMHPALPYFEKMVERTSELDMTMKLHTFPQKLQYVQKCEGVSKERKCYGGKVSDGSTCGACQGRGYKVHTTAQDAIFMPMPDNKEEMIPLANIIAYVAPPIDIINVQREYLRELKSDAIQAVYNSDVFVQNSIAKTATEKQLDYESIYDTLTPFANKYSELWIDLVSVFSALVNLKVEVIDIKHSFPSDLKLKTVSTLMVELQLANESNAPSFLRDDISQDIAEALYADDDLGLLKHNVKRSFFPFNGKTQDEISLATASEYVSRFDKVLYYNFEKIFAEIERDDNTFWLKKYPEQWAMIGEKVNAIIEDLDEKNADRFSVGDLTGANQTKNANQSKGANPNNGGANDPNNE